MQKAIAHFGRIDVLVNNAGIARDDLAEDVKEDGFRPGAGSTNLKGTFFTTQAVGKTMIARKSGRIINISSQAGTVTLRGEPIYCMTKGGDQSPDKLPGGGMGPLGHGGQQRFATFIWTDGTRPSLSDPEFHKRNPCSIFPSGASARPRRCPVSSCSLGVFGG